VALSRKYLGGFEWKVEIGPCDRPNSLPGGFAEVEAERDEKVAGAVSTPVASAMSFPAQISQKQANTL